MILKFVISLALFGAARGACPKSEYDLTQNIVDMKKTPFIYNAYVKCINNASTIFGTGWIDEVCNSFDEQGKFNSTVPFAYAFEVYCADREMGVVDSKTHLEDEKAYTKVIGTNPTGYSKYAECIGKCNRGEVTLPNIPVGKPTPDQLKNPILTPEYVEYTPKAFNLVFCAMRCAWPDAIDANQYSWSRAFFRVILQTTAQ